MPKVTIRQLADALARRLPGGPTKLARHPDPTTHDALLKTARQTGDPHALGVLAALRRMRSAQVAVDGRIRQPLAVPRKLARTITYIGDPGGPAFGYWDGGHERSRVVEASDPDEAETLARGAGEHSGLWFTPGEGNDTLHVLVSPGTPEAVHSVLAKHGVTNMTLLPRGSSTVAHVVDEGSELTDSIRSAVADLRARYKAVTGTAGFSVL